jgi:secreted trypsin-like serine protease
MKIFNVLSLHFIKSVILSALVFAVFGLSRVSGSSLEFLELSEEPDENFIQLVERLSADLEIYPWQVAVYQTVGTNRKFCAGSLIHREWVLTSADCASNRDIATARVSGEKVAKNAHLNGEGQNREVAQIIIHPGYNASTWENNVALIKLASPMDLGPLLNTIPLMTSDWVELGMQNPGVIAAVTGWQTTIEGAPGDNRLRMGFMPITNKLGSLSTDQIKPDMILAGNPQQTNDFCFGDTGGPMAVKDNSSPVGHRLAGVNNKGFGCYGSGKPGVFTSVASHYVWISSETGIVVPKPEENFVFVNFFANKTLLYETQTAVFTDTSAGAEITSWEWNFGLDANPATAIGQGPHSVTWNSFGKKTVSLKINGDATDTKVDYIDVLKLPVLTVNITGNGVVKVDDNVYTEPVKTFAGTILSLEAIASTYWRFSGWSGDLISTNETETILINNLDITVTALFVELIKPNVAWPEASAIKWGQDLSESALLGGNASWEENPVAGEFSFDAPDFKPETGTYEAAVTFYPEDTANYQPVKGTVTVQVNKIVPEVTEWPVASAITYGDNVGTSSLTGGEVSVDGTFLFDNQSVTPNAGIYTADVTFTPDDTDNYETVSGTVDILVSKASPEVTAWPGASAITYGDNVGLSALTGGEVSVDGAFTFDNPAVTPDAGTYTADVTFTPDDTDNYETVSGTVDILVNKAIPGVTTWPVASAIIYGENVGSSALTGGEASVDGTFAFDSPAVTPVAGTYTADATFTPYDTDNYEIVSGTVDVLVNKATPGVTAWPFASAITYGENVGSSNLSGSTVSVDGSFDFNNPEITPDAGTYDVAVSFTPDDTENFETVVGEVIAGEQG